MCGYLDTLDTALISFGFFFFCRRKISVNAAWLQRKVLPTLYRWRREQAYIYGYIQGICEYYSQGLDPWLKESYLH